MNIAERAFAELYPGKDKRMYVFNVKYSGKFSSYNANVKYTKSRFADLTTYNFQLSRDWEERSDEIKIGLIQSLFQKIFKTNIKTINQDLYDNFIKNVHMAVPKDRIEPKLRESFNRVNEQYFLGTVDMPNLVFGERSFSKLGSYQYGNDTITMSQVFESVVGDDIKLLDYVMYHEMLHKIHKFKMVNGRSRHHTTKFRMAERQFEGAEALEHELKVFLRKKKLKSYFGF